MAFAMFSTAMRKNPSAISSGRRPSPILGRQGFEPAPHNLGVDRLAAALAEDLGEIGGEELADHDVGVRDGKRSTTR